jgi:hypothetical protein
MKKNSNKIVSFWKSQGLPTRVANTLNNNGINSYVSLANLSEQKFRCYRYCGRQTIELVRNLLLRKGLDFNYIHLKESLFVQIQYHESEIARLKEIEARFALIDKMAGEIDKMAGEMPKA